MAEFRPLNIANAFFEGENQRRNIQQADQVLQRGDQFNVLAQNPQATPEQYARIGRSDVANALTNEQSGMAEKQQQAAKMIYQAAQYALASPNPKAFIEQNYPQLAQSLGPQWAAADDNAVRAKMQEALGIWGPRAGIGPASKYQTVQGPRGSVLQVNPDTNEQKQVVGPDNSQPGVGGPKYRPLTKQEIESYGLPAGTTAQIDTNTGKIDLINKPNAASVGRPLPPQITKGLVENNSNIRKIDSAIAALDQYPDAFGAWNYVGDSIRQRSDPKGVEPRAKVADIGSMIIHDRSGAAVSASEFPRLAPFVPQATDDSATVRKKLINLKANIQMMNEETQQIYSPEQGYKEFNVTPQAPQQAPPQAQPQAQPQEVTATGPNGQKIVLRNGQWVPL